MTARRGTAPPAQAAPVEGKVTLAVIAAEAGVSLPTVSKVVNGRTDVAAQTRQRIEELLTRHNYLRPVRATPARARVVELVFNELDSPWAIQILRGVEEFHTDRDWAVAVSAIRHGPVARDGWIAGLLARQTDGVILVTSEITDAQTAELRSRGIPLVVIDPANVPGPDVASVGATNWAGGMAATEHLVELGHRRIGMISGPQSLLCSRARIDGYCFAIERAGIALDRSLIRHGDFHHEGGFLHASELLDSADPPTAFFAGSDQQALGVYEAARQRGLRIPQDLSVVGFDDLPVSRWLSPPLTTIRQPLTEMGRTAADMLERMVEGGRQRARRVELATELIVRESTAALPGHHRNEEPT